MSTYMFARSGFDLESATLQQPLDCGDLVTFLGVAQRLDIDFLPITWQPALDCIGQGATAEIRETFANLQFSFAFKRPKLATYFTYEEIERRLLPCIIAELSTLGLKSIRQHPNIVHLEGICWEVITSEGENVSREVLYSSNKGGIIPVLVFEKAKYGDLHHFMMQEAGKKLTFGQKIGICTDIAMAVAEMHYHDIIHGDLKPQNVLIFDNDEGGYIARVADFGYSTQWALPNDLIQMPKSRPWAAPEWHHRGFTPAQAIKMDSYSFGMVVLWLLGYAALNNADHIFERDLHVASETADLARPLAESIFEAHKLDLYQFFKATLTHNEMDRSSNFEHLQEFLTAEKITGRKEIFRKADGSRFVRTHSGYVVKTLKDSINLETVEFQVISSMYQFYQADFRVRIHVVNALLRKLASLEGRQKESPILQNLFFQCAVCYEVGFGVVRDPSKSQELMSRCGEYDRINFTRELEVVRGNRYEWGLYDGVNTNYRKMLLAETGNGAPKNSLSLFYIRQRNVEDIELQYRKEIIDVENGLGASHRFVFVLKKELSDLLIQRGQRGKAEEIGAQIKDRSMRLLQYDPSRDFGNRDNLAAIVSLSEQAGREREAEEMCHKELSSVSNTLGISSPRAAEILRTLSTITGLQERWNEAELYMTQAIETSTKALGPTHPDNMARARDLARIYAKQGKWEEAETLVTRSIETSIKILGEEHIISISSVAHLVWMRILRQQQLLQQQRQWTTIESQQIEVMKKYIKCQGLNYGPTVGAVNNLAMIWSEQRLWRIAATLFRHVVKQGEKVFGKEDPRTLDYMSNMAYGYKREMMRKRSLAPIIGKRQTCDGTLFRKVVELSTKILGWDDPLTLDRAAWLARVLADQRKFKEAEMLQVRILETTIRLQGEKHPDALDAMRDLAIAIRKQGRLREAITLMDKGVEGKSRFVRLCWRLGLSLGLFDY